MKLIRNFAHGLVFGVAQVMPGISGGTIAIILGFYDRLLATLNHFRKNPRKHAAFLLPFLMGAGGGLVLFSMVVDHMLRHFSFPAMLFFVGLIAGIVPSIYGKVKPATGFLSAKDVALVAVPVAVLAAIALFTGTPEAQPPEAMAAAIDIPFMVFLFAMGALAAASLIIPGFSGTLVLILAGVYHLALFSVSSLPQWLLDTSNTALLWDSLKVLVPLGLGIVVGGLTTARLVESLLKRYFRPVYLVVLGLLIGSVFALLTEPMLFQSGVTPLLVVMGVGTCVLGALASFLLGRRKN